MQRFTRYLVIIASSFQFSGCTLSYFASKNQKITIQKDSLATLLIGDSLPKLDSGRYVIPRIWEETQIKLSKPGYKDEYRILMPYKLSALAYGTIILNTAVAMIPMNNVYKGIQEDFEDTSGSGMFLVLGATIGSALGTGYTMMGAKLWNYDSKVNFNIPMQRIYKRDSTMKELYLNKVAFDVSKSNLKIQTVFSPGKYYNNKLPNKWKELNKKGIKLNNSVFADEINKNLKKNGFIDTSGLVLRGGYKDNLFLNTTITEFKVTDVYHPSTYVGFSKLMLKTKWEILDIYKNTIYADTFEIQSGEFAIDKTDEDSYYRKMINDALESGLYKLMNTSRFSNTIKIPITNSVDELTDIAIKRPTKTVSNLEEAVKASVTIRTKNRHGSGFLISDDGYIISNYHVVADSTNLEIVLNNGQIRKAKIIQSNKDMDLSLLKIEISGIKPFLLSDLGATAMGMEIYAIGTPKAQDLSQTLSKGIISSIRKHTNGQKILQTDASVNAGNSGGPLVDIDGKILGVVNAKLMGSGVEGISFAIPINQVLSALKIQLK